MAAGLYVDPGRASKLGGDREQRSGSIWIQEPVLRAHLKGVESVEGRQFGANQWPGVSTGTTRGGFTQSILTPGHHLSNKIQAPLCAAAEF